MRPFKKFMLLDYQDDDMNSQVAVKYGGNCHQSSWTLTLRIVSWWGLTDRIIKRRVYVSFYVDAYSFYSKRVNKWFKNGDDFQQLKEYKTKQ